MSKIAIITALDRELHPLVRNWKPSSFSYGNRSYRVYQRDNVIAFAGGIGKTSAILAAKAVVANYQPETLLSAGLAGALIHTLKVGNVITPNVIMDAACGSEYRCDSGGGVLVSAAEITGPGSKQELVEHFHALAVDMEAAGVAEVARAEQIGFGCVKAISDEADFVLPPLKCFVDAQGGFQTGRFVAWASVRPAVWPATIALARNSNRAVRALCDWLARNIQQSAFSTQPVARNQSEECGVR